MKVNSIPSYNLYSKTSFGAVKKSDYSLKKSRDKQIKIANTKKVVSECITVAFGLTILYFAMKRNFMKNEVQAEIKKRAEQTKNSVPPYIINTDVLKPFLQ